MSVYIPHKWLNFRTVIRYTLDSHPLIDNLGLDHDTMWNEPASGGRREALGHAPMRSGRACPCASGAWRLESRERSSSASEHGHSRSERWVWWN